MRMKGGQITGITGRSVWETVSRRVPWRLSLLPERSGMMMVDVWSRTLVTVLTCWIGVLDRAIPPVAAESSAGVHDRRRVRRSTVPELVNACTIRMYHIS
jgi:hypothetical protein